MKNKKIFIFTIVILLSVLSSCNKKTNTLSLYVIEENGLYGYIDFYGNRIVEPQYIYAQRFSEDLALVVVDTIYGERVDSLAYKREGGDVRKRPCLYVKYGYIDKTGTFVIKPTMIASCFFNNDEIFYDINNSTYLNRFPFSCERALCQDTVTWKYGYIDKKGNVVIPTTYEYGNFYSQSRAIVMKDTGKELGVKEGPNGRKSTCHFGIIDENDSVIADFIYYDITNYSSNHVIARTWKKADMEGPIDLMAKNKEGDGYHIDKIQSNDIWQDIVVILDRYGNIKDSLTSFCSYYSFSNSGIGVSKSLWLSHFLGKNCYSFIDTLGNFIKPLDGISKEQANEMILSKQAMALIPDDADIYDCTCFSDNLAGITMNGDVWVFVDKHLLIRGKGLEDTYELIRPFNNGLAAVKKNAKWGYVNTALKRVVECKYDSCEDNFGFLEKVYTFKGDSITSMYINRRDSVVWKYTYLRELENKYNNKYSQKSKKDFGKWRDDVTIDNSFLKYYYVYILCGIIFTIIAIWVYVRKKQKK